MDLSKLTKLPQVGKQMKAEVNRTLILLHKKLYWRNKPGYKTVLFLGRKAKSRGYNQSWKKGTVFIQKVC